MKRGWNLAKKIVTVTFADLLKYVNERDPRKVKPLVFGVVNRIIDQGCRGQRRHDLPGLRINDDELTGIPSVNKQTMIGFVERHRSVVVPFLSDRPYVRYDLFLPIDHGNGSFGVEVHEHPR